MFTFPEDSFGIEQGISYDDIIKAVKKKFFDKFGEISDIKWHYNATPHMNNLEYV
jgi:hypothetical protein